MDLISLSLTGWRRFKNQTTLQTSGKIVSILGPNEAGKSSLLQALRFLRTSETAKASDFARDCPHDQLKIVGYFSLDKSELSGAGLEVSTRLRLTKRAEGAATFVLEPPAPQRDIVPRAKVAAQLKRSIGNSKFSEQITDDLTESLEAALEIIESTEEDLTSEQKAEIKTFYSLLNKLEFQKCPGYVNSLAHELEALIALEEVPNPREKANSYISKRIPQILLFGQDERNLNQSYDFDDLASEIPTALSNLANIADLDIKNLIQLIDDDDVAGFEGLKAQANDKLRKRFDETWSQSGVHITFTTAGRVLNVIIENEPYKFTNLAERSDGFRQFVALQSFIMKSRAASPILLIDEAELHLHYDAQADLIQMLSRQDVASKIIFTTHSAGCLPEDLGNGVRLVSRIDSSSSKIINRFWGASEPGFSPLLIGMGASTLAFFPIRKALVVEGEAEMLLLPTLIREALGSVVIGFQTVPGLSKANKGLLPLTGTKKNHIAYLTDGDVGGRALVKELRQNKVNSDSIFCLTSVDGGDCQIEDFISPKILEAAVNNIIAKFNPGKEAVTLKNLPVTGRITAVSQTFKTATGKELSKVDLAYEVLDLKAGVNDTSLLDAKQVKAFKACILGIERYFNAETVSAAA